MITSVQPDQVYHLAGISKTFGVAVSDYDQINTMGTYYVAKAVLDTFGDQTKLLFVSSASVYGATGQEGRPLNETDAIKPTSDYGVSKASAELYLMALQAKGLNCVIARPFNHTGPGQQLGFVCPDLVHRLQDSIKQTPHGQTPILQAGKLDAVRDFTDVRDVVEAYELIMNQFASGHVVNVASGVGVSVRQIIDILVHDVAKLPEVEISSMAEQMQRADEDAIIGDIHLLTSRAGWRSGISLGTTLRDLWLEGVNR
jgi:GDP-4-dehydro-6-deoxy-D-mannose reductase